MKLSELIKDLEAILEEHGDLDVEDNSGEVVEAHVLSCRGFPQVVVGGP